MGHTASNLLVHVVFSTKNREKWLTAAVRERLFAYFAQVVNDEGGQALVVNGGLEHVHVLLRLPPKHALADLVRRMKASSSAWLRRGRLPQFAWQEGYSAFSVSQSQRQRVYDYIAGQEAHHRHQPYESELISLLKRNEVQYDERYLWS
jgi:REP element-mobilizing transposase RayT